MVFYAARAPGGTAFAPGRLLAFDADPKTDLDDDGRPDEGPADLSIGEPYDLVWSAPLLGDPFCVSPAVATMDAGLPGPPVGVSRPVVIATSSDGVNGHIQAFDATTGAPVWTRSLAPGPGGARLAVSSPVVGTAGSSSRPPKGRPGRPST
jgi:outer membrane protein assembly factor BamB